MKKLALTSIAFAAIAVSQSAMAEPYIGYSVGQSRADVSCSAGAFTCDKSDVAMKLFGGYRLGAHWAVEASFARLGKASSSAEAIGGGTMTGELRTSAIGFGGAYFHDINDSWRAVGRLGLASTKVRGSLVEPNGSLTVSERHVSPYLGLGISYKITPHVSIDGTWDMNKVKFEGNSGNTQTYSIGVGYSF